MVNDSVYYLSLLSDKLNQLKKILSDSDTDEFMTTYTKNTILHSPNLFMTLEAFYNKEVSLELQQKVLELFLPAFLSEINDPLAVTKVVSELKTAQNNNKFHFLKIDFIEDNEKYITIYPFNELIYKTENKNIERLNKKIQKLVQKNQDYQDQIDQLRLTDSNPDRMYDDKKIGFGKYLSYLIHGDKVTKDLIDKITPLQNKIKYNNNQIDDLKLDLEQKQNTQIKFQDKINFITDDCNRIKDQFVMSDNF